MTDKPNKTIITKIEEIWIIIAWIILLPLTLIFKLLEREKNDR